jgi:hypothetical protein
LFLAIKLYQFSIIIFKIEESIEESLDVLDEKYKLMNEVLKKPIFFDSVEVRQVIENIRDCHSTILSIAQKLTEDMGSINEIEEKNDENQ